MIWSGWRSETRLLHQHTLLWCRAATLRINGGVVEEEGESLVLASKSNVAETEYPHPTPTLKSVHTSYGSAGKRMFREGWGKEKKYKHQRQQLQWHSHVSRRTQQYDERTTAATQIWNFSQTESTAHVCHAHCFMPSARGDFHALRTPWDEDKTSLLETSYVFYSALNCP